MTKINNRRINYASNLSPDAPHHALFTSISVETRRVKMSQFLLRLLSDDYYVTVEKKSLSPSREEKFGLKSFVVFLSDRSCHD